MINAFYLRQASLHCSKSCSGLMPVIEAVTNSKHIAVVLKGKNHC